jgi:hypothetical protein
VCWEHQQLSGYANHFSLKSSHRVMVLATKINKGTWTVMNRRFDHDLTNKYHGITQGSCCVVSPWDKKSLQACAEIEGRAEDCHYKKCFFIGHVDIWLIYGWYMLIQMLIYNDVWYIIYMTYVSRIHLWRPTGLQKGCSSLN